MAEQLDSVALARHQYPLQREEFNLLRGPLGELAQLQDTPVSPIPKESDQIRAFNQPAVPPVAGTAAVALPVKTEDLGHQAPGPRLALGDRVDPPRAPPEKDRVTGMALT